MAQHLTERDRWGRLKYPPQVERAVSISPARKGLQYNGAGRIPRYRAGALRHHDQQEAQVSKRR
jgi:hypothetical protein